MHYSIAQQSFQGGRDYNEDSTAIFERENATLLVVADGLGGHEGGDLASQTLVSALGRSFKKATESQLQSAEIFLNLSITYAHKMIHRRAINQGYRVDGPKTTCVACLIYKGIARWAHSGDSRLYLIRDGQIMYVTRDHVSQRSLDESNSPLSQCVGGLDSPRPEISPKVKLKKADSLVLASDGAWHTFTTEDMKTYIDPKHPTLGLDTLLHNLEGRNKSPSDNLSMVMLFWEIRQRDDPPVNDYTDHRVKKNSRERIQKKAEQNREKFDISNLDDAIVEIEDFISDLDDKI